MSDYKCVYQSVLLIPFLNFTGKTLMTVMQYLAVTFDNVNLDPQVCVRVCARVWGSLLACSPTRASEPMLLALLWYKAISPIHPAQARSNRRTLQVGR